MTQFEGCVGVSNVIDARAQFRLLGPSSSRLLPCSRGQGSGNCRSEMAEPLFCPSSGWTGAAGPAALLDWTNEVESVKKIKGSEVESNTENQILNDNNNSK